jgi:hypothetical protein
MVKFTSIMNEFTSPIELTRARADGIVADLQQMFDLGLPPAHIAAAHQEETSLHRDLLRVQLGLKPAGSFLLPVFSNYTLPDGTFAFGAIEKHNVGGVAYDTVGGTVWRPNLVRDVIEDPANTKLVLRCFDQNPALAEALLEGYDSDTFSLFLATITQPGQTPDQLALAGLLYGIPKSAAVAFGNYRAAMQMLPAPLWAAAEKAGIETSVPVPETVMSVTSNKAVSDEFARLLKGIGFPDEALIRYLESLRLADIPGHPFVTSGDMTVLDEAKMRADYHASGLETKLEKLLEINGGTGVRG